MSNCVATLNMFRNCGNFNKISSFYYILRIRACKLDCLCVPSVCGYQQSKFICANTIQNKLRPPSFNFVKETVRYKSKDHKKGVLPADSDSDEEDENETDEYDADGNKVRKLKLKSMRVDSILGKCMGLTRRRIDELFFESKFRLNGKPLAKKSIELKVGDKLDICSNPVNTGGTTDTVANITIQKIKPLDETTYFVTFSSFRTK